MSCPCETKALQAGCILLDSGGMKQVMLKVSVNESYEGETEKVQIFDADTGTEITSGYQAIIPENCAEVAHKQSVQLSLLEIKEALQNYSWIGAEEVVAGNLTVPFGAVELHAQNLTGETVLVSYDGIHWKEVADKGFVKTASSINLIRFMLQQGSTAAMKVIVDYFGVGSGPVNPPDPIEPPM